MFENHQPDYLINQPFENHQPDEGDECTQKDAEVALQDELVARWLICPRNNSRFQLLFICLVNYYTLW